MISPERLEEARRLIEQEGWRIHRGPYFNSNLYGRKGVSVWSIKTFLSKKELESRGILADKSAPPDTVRTVRFLGIFDEEGNLCAVKHVSSSGRKDLGRNQPRNLKRSSLEREAAPPLPGH